MSFRGSTNKFFYDRVHDMVLYYLILERVEFQDEDGDVRTTSSGNLKIKGGWKAIGAEMSFIFKRPFKPSQLRQRFFLFSGREDQYLERIFDDVGHLSDQVGFVRGVMES